MAVSQNLTLQSFATTMTKTISSPGNDLDREPISQRRRVLVVDDDPDFIEMTKMILCQAGFDVAGALSCNISLEKCIEVKPDVILLDLMMPEVDGFMTFQRLKEITQVPVIVVTASGDRENAAKSLQAGMEDYLSKPFYNTELVARIQAALRRSRAYETENLQVFPEVDLLINFDTREVILRGKHIRLVPREFAVLSILARRAPKPAAYAAIAEEMWGADTPKNRTHLKNIVFSIRQKLEAEPKNPKLLVNYRSLGYQLLTRPG